MKHVVLILLTLLLLFGLFAYATEESTETDMSAAKVEISVTYSTNGYNSVGNNWSNYFSVNQKQLNKKEIFILTEGMELSLYAQFKEDDKKPDLGYDTKILTIDREMLEYGATIPLRINVRENAGRYAGNVCTWNVTFTLKFVEWTDLSAGIQSIVTANTVALTEANGNTVYIKKGEKLMVTGYSEAIDRFTAEYNGKEGLIKGIGLDCTREQLVELLVMLQEDIR